MKKGQTQLRMLLSVISMLFVLSGCGLEGDPSLHQLVGGGSVNTPPIANAGKDQRIEVGETITVSGSGTDSDGVIVSYEWKKGDTLLSEGASVDYTATEIGTVTLVLTVMDDDGATDSDEMNITVTAAVANSAPAAVISKPSASITYYCYEGPNPTIVLEGNESSDPDGDTLTYSWSATAGANAVSINKLIGGPSSKNTVIIRDDLCNFVDNDDNGVNCSTGGYGSRLAKRSDTDTTDNDAIYDPSTDGGCTVTIDLNVSDGKTSGTDSTSVTISIMFPT